MTTKDPAQQIKDHMIEENLKRAFTDKANEDVPTELLSLLAQLKSQDEENDRG